MGIFGEDTVQTIRSRDDAFVFAHSGSSAVAIYFVAPISRAFFSSRSSGLLQQPRYSPGLSQQEFQKWPSPSAPMIPTLLPGPAPCWIRGVKDLMQHRALGQPIQRQWHRESSAQMPRFHASISHILHKPCCHQAICCCKC